MNPVLPILPPGERIYAVGDIHGRLDLLTRLIGQIEADIVNNPIASYRWVFLGDYIDRGAESKGTIDALRNLATRHPVVALRGNHEDVMLQFLKGDFDLGASWLQWGGIATLASYGVPVMRPCATRDMAALHADFTSRVPTGHTEFLESLPTCFTLGDYYFVHAGVKPGVPLDQQTAHDQMWMRGEFLSHTGDFGKMVVHGHSIEFKPDHRPNRIGIDTGAYATSKLTCLRLEADRQHFLST